MRSLLTLLAFLALPAFGAEASHESMIRALQTDRSDAVIAAITDLGAQHDIASLSLIDQAIARADERERPRLAFALYAFHSVDTDAIAKRYLSGADFDDYLQARDASLQ